MYRAASVGNDRLKRITPVDMEPAPAIRDLWHVIASAEDVPSEAAARTLLFGERVAERRAERWLVTGEHPTIADVACFPDVALGEEGGVARQDYPAVRRWLDRMRRLPGFVTMPGVFPGSPE
jgi:glutathione S-transferase